MATVYLAQDLRHNRKVAVKVLRSELAATMGTERFLHEIEVAAQLQHPNILPLLDSGNSDGFLYYVMPFIEGQTLRNRLEREGELPIGAAVRILIEVVDALAEAHRNGVIHRDIKPENVLLTGRHALVADFGVAKAVNEATGRHQLTTAGVALGTPAYMAPEQAAAEPNLDGRVDIYAVGAMACELLTGRPPFEGTSAAQVLTKHMTQAPEAITLRRASIPPALEAVVMKCLEKRPADRWQSADELLAQLEPIAATPSGGITPTTTVPVKAVGRTGAQAPGSKRMLVIGAAAGILLVAVAAFLFRPRADKRIEFGPIRPVTSEPGLELHPALSPDGKVLAYAAGPIGAMRVYVRSVSGGTPVPVARELMVDQQRPSWSPDGTRLLFASAGSIYVVQALGGAPRVLGPGFLAIWSPDGKSYAYSWRDTLFVRAIEGGTPRLLDTGPELHSPAWSPDGKFIAYIQSNAGFATGSNILGNLSPTYLKLVAAAGGAPLVLAERKFLNMSPAWMPDSRHLLFMSTRDGGRDLYSLAINGSAQPRGEAIRLTTGMDIGTFSVAADGRTLAYSAFTNTSNVWAVPIPASGTVSEKEATQLTTGTQHVEGVGLSRDGQWLAFDSDRQGNPDIYRVPVAGGETQQVSTDPSFDFIPTWSPDGKRIAFQSWRNASRDIFVINADGTGEQLAAGGPGMEFYADWGPDGRTLVFQSDRSGQLQLYITRETAPGQWDEPRQLTKEGAFSARWAPDGSLISYLSPSGIGVIAPNGTGHRVLVSQESPLAKRLAKLPADGPDFAVWSADSKTVVIKITLGGHATFWTVPAAGGTPRMVARFENPAFAVSRQEFASDGKRIFFTADDRQSDIKVMEVRP